MKENKEEDLVYGVLCILIFPIIIISSLWTTYIIWDICKLFGLTYLTQYGYEVFFGSNIVLGFIAYKFKSSEPEKTSKQTFINTITVQMGYFTVWGLAYLLHWIMKF